MIHSPAMLTIPTLREQRAFLPARGGTLGRVNTQYPAPFSFLGQTAKQLQADRADGHEPVAVSLAAGEAGAAMDRRGSPSRVESRPFLLPKINHVTHSLISIADCVEASRRGFS